MRILVSPLPLQNLQLLLGADWAQRLGIRIEWPGPVLAQTHSKNKCQAVQPEAPPDLIQH